MTDKPRTGGLRRTGRLLAGLMALAAFSGGVPWLLWSAAGGRLLPEPGAGGWTEVWAQVQSGLLPDSAVMAVVVVTGWAIWSYLALMFVAELRIGWRDRDLVPDRLAQVSGPRRLMARMVGWLLAGHTMAASLLISPPADLVDPPALAAMVETDPATLDLSSSGEGTSHAPAFDPHAYVNFAVDAPLATADGGDVVEREIVPGDNLWNIAEELTGDGFNFRAIWAATDLDTQDPPVDPTNPDLIFPGNVVRIPSDLLTPAASAQAPTTPTPPPEPDPENSPAADPVSPAAAPETSAPMSAPGEEATEPAAPVDAPATAPAEQDQGPDGGFALAAVPPALVAAFGLGGAGGAVLLAGVVRRRRRAVAASDRGQRPPKQDRRAARTSQRLQADLPSSLWDPQDLVASWNSLQPADPGPRQPWCVRWNSTLQALECAWTPDPTAPATSGPDEPPAPGPGSPWRLVSKRDRSGQPVPVWTLVEADIPPAPARLVVPAMVGCANGRRDRPSTDGFYINLEAAGILAVESTNPDLIDPEGVARALLLQLQANGAAEVHLLETDLGFDDVDREIHLDPMALESQLVTELTANQDLWDEAQSMFELRSAGRYDGPTIVVVGPAEQLQHCSHLLSLARAGNVPLAVIALGPMANAWATFLLEPEPDKHAIRFPSARAVVTFDHLSWVSTTDAADLLHLIATSARPWRDPTPTAEPDHDDPDLDDDPDFPPAPARRPNWADHPIAPDADPNGSTSDSANPFTGTGLLTLNSAGNGPGPSSDPPDDWPDTEQDQDDSDAARVAELWDSLPEANPTSLADNPTEAAYESDDDLDWAIPGDDDIIGHALDASLDDLLPSGHSSTDTGSSHSDQDTPTNGSEASSGPDDHVPADVPWSAVDESHPPGGEGRASAVMANGSRSMAQSTLRLDTRPDPKPDAASPPTLDQPALSADDGDLLNVASAFGASGLRLEVCGPIRLLHRSPCGSGFVEVLLGGGSGLTGARLALLAYLAVAGRSNGRGIGRDQIAAEFWPEVHNDGTLRQVRTDTVKRRVWDLRKVLTQVTGVHDGRALVEAVDGEYTIGDIVCDWHELRATVLLAESEQHCSDRWCEAVATIEQLIRPPGLLTPPGGARSRSQFSWIEHYEARTYEVSQRVVTVLTSHARQLTKAGQHQDALRVLATARNVSHFHPKEVADGVVATYLALGDLALAEHSCAAYESQFDQAFRDREREKPQPGSPRARIGAYLARRST